MWRMSWMSTVVLLFYCGLCINGVSHRHLIIIRSLWCYQILNWHTMSVMVLYGEHFAHSRGKLQYSQCNHRLSLVVLSWPKRRQLPNISYQFELDKSSSVDHIETISFNAFIILHPYCPLSQPQTTPVCLHGVADLCGRFPNYPCWHQVQLLYFVSSTK